MNSNCDSCNNFIYDEEFEEYVCEVDMDQDEMGNFLTNSFFNVLIINLMMNIR